LKESDPPPNEQRATTDSSGCWLAALDASLYIGLLLFLLVLITKLREALEP
jgi:hypothetical protein